MWNRISIRWQLIALLSLAIITVEISALAVDAWSDRERRRVLALEQAETISESLQLDLLKMIVQPSTANYTDLNFRINKYPSITQLLVSTASGNDVFDYRRVGAQIDATEQMPWGDQSLFIVRPVEVDGHRFGDVRFVFDLDRYNTGLRQQLVSKSYLFTAQLLVALVLAWFISRNYTRPFSDLARNMRQVDIKSGEFPQISTAASNEIGTLYQGYNALVAEIDQTTRELQYRIQHDSLTGLLNRYAFDQQLEKVLGSEFLHHNVVLMLDLDNFKLINDVAGHVAGDEMLKQVGQVLSAHLHREHFIARAGGDDFSILLPNCSQTEGVQQAYQLLDAVKAFRFNWHGSLYTITCSMGLVSFKPGEFSLTALYVAVDTAFYMAKSQGQNKLSVYTVDDRQIEQYRSDVQTVSIIQEALGGQGKARFELYAQSIVPLQKTSLQISYEILLRLRDANGDMVYPDLFLPAANRFQLMVAIDTFVLWDYLETVVQHPQHVQRLAFVNINLGGSTLNHPDFQSRLREAINHFDFPWNKLVLEVTETSAVGDLAQAQDFINHCRQIGIRVALDDFGTGMASFEYLKHLPLDVVKIDGSFVRDMLTDPVDYAMVSYACDISRLQGRETIAEFVEEQGHFEALTRIGIDYAQGYFLDKPMPLSGHLNK